MCTQIFFVTSLRGSGSVPTILARSSEGCIGFIKPVFFACGVVFAIFSPSLGASPLLSGLLDFPFVFIQCSQFFSELLGDVAFSTHSYRLLPLHFALADRIDRCRKFTAQPNSKDY
jgi:hypothetical protein